MTQDKTGIAIIGSGSAIADMHGLAIAEIDNAQIAFKTRGGSISVPNPALTARFTISLKEMPSWRARTLSRPARSSSSVSVVLIKTSSLPCVLMSRHQTGK